MGSEPLVTVIIDNYNYAGFVAEAIESALTQTYSRIETIVVDDGSTDDSRDVIRSFGHRIKSIFKSNGGQGSAFNAGFSASCGDIIILLDSDDILLPTAVERAVPFFSDAEVAKVHWPMVLVDENRVPLNRMLPDGPLDEGEVRELREFAEGDLREFVYQHGPTHLLNAPNSGNAWARWLLDELFPLPEALYRNGCDTFLFEAAPFFGKIGRLPSPQTLYRQHGRNDHASMNAEAKVARELQFYEHYSEFLAAHCRSRNILVNTREWRRRSWWHLHDALLKDVARLPHPELPLIVIDDGALEMGRFAGRERFHFLDRAGAFFGPPADEAAAIAELDRLRKAGAGHIVVAWNSFWWREQYPAFFDHLSRHFQKLLDNERCMVFALCDGENSLDTSASE